jgi:hypothetical protein
VVFMSGYAEEKLKAAELADEQSTFIMKPFDPPCLVQIISDNIRRPSGAVSTEIQNE